MSEISSFLTEHIDKWYPYADYYISHLKKPDNIVFKALIKKLDPSIDESQIPNFETVDSFIDYWVDHDGPVDWRGLSRHSQISAKTYLKWVGERHHDIFMEYLYKNYNIPEEFYIKLFKIYNFAWYKLGNHPKLSEKTILKLIEDQEPLSWEKIQHHPSITEQTFLRWIDEGKKMNWIALSYHPNITERTYFKWIEEGKEINWIWLSMHPKISEDTFLKWIAEGRPLDYAILCGNPNISEKTILRWIEEGKPLNYANLCRNPNVSEKTFLRWSDEDRPLDYNILCRNPNISEKTFLKWIGEGKEINLGRLSENINVSGEAFLKILQAKRIDSMHWDVSNSKFSEEVCRDLIAKNPYIDWNWMSMNPNLSISFLREHLDKISWKYLIKNKFIGSN